MSSYRFDPHVHITGSIVAMLEKGAGEFELPWHQPAGQIWRPLNVATGKRYSGVNVIALWAAAQERGFTSGTWGTFKQWRETGAQVRRGEKAAFALFYRPGQPSYAEGNDDTPEKQRQRFIARATPVFAVEQVEGYQPDLPPKHDPVESVHAAETFIAGTRAAIVHEGHQAFYRPSTDTIHMPPQDAFIGTKSCSPSEAYYATVLHELIHWAGAEHRCNRQLGRRFGLEAYAMEELTAELGAAFLCADLGISSAPRPDHASYLASWLQLLKVDKRAIFTAASQASRGVAFLESLQPAEGVNPALAACAPPAACPAAWLPALAQ